MQLSSRLYEATRSALLDSNSDPLIEFIHRMKLSIPHDTDVSHLAKWSVELGWLKPGGIWFTPEGELLGDSLREYQFWRSRGRQLPAEGQDAHLSRAYYAGKSVVEIGAGFGSNLLSIRESAKEVIGIEPSIIYQQMSAILCEREGLAPLDLRSGSGEHTSLKPGSCDLVLCVSVHQYTNVHDMIAEAARILVPGGELQIVGGTIGTYARVGLEPILRGSMRSSIAYAKTVANTLSYMTMRRRLVGHNRSSTSYPIYPPRHSLHKWLGSAGFNQLRPHGAMWPETIFCYGKPSLTPAAMH